MFDSTYEVTKVSVSSNLPGGLYLHRTVYRFKNQQGERYLIFVTEYPNRFHTIDFCRTSQQYARSRFTELANGQDAIRIISTVVHLMVDLLLAGYEDEVCFGFIGARMDNELPKNSSKRFRIYRSIMLNLIDPIKFRHLEDTSLDAYVVLNTRADPAEVLRTAKEVFEKEEE